MPIVTSNVDFSAVKQYLVDLQSQIVTRLEALDGRQFKRDEWQRPEGGGGVSLVIEEGGVFERGGVNFSHVAGKTLPPSATDRKSTRLNSSHTDISRMPSSA